VPPLYFFPCVEQRGLLYLPLLFHEFGHLLYACHKQEMDALVSELRQKISDALVPASQRNDPHARDQAAERQAIVNVWYDWAQEFYCDATGFVIGGPCFLEAFSAFLMRMDRADFSNPLPELRRSLHPVTWLRIKLLAKRAVAAGFPDLAQRVTEEWQVLAQHLAVEEDYHGFYDDTLAPLVERAVVDMLTEAAPAPYTDADAAGGESLSPSGSPVALLNRAWQVYQSDPVGYPEWQSTATKGFFA
jgi:hypothetical protein